MRRYFIFLSALILIVGCNNSDRPILNWDIHSSKDTSGLTPINDSIFLKKYILENDIISYFSFFSRCWKDTSTLNSFKKTFYERQKEKSASKGHYFIYQYYQTDSNKFFIISKNIKYLNKGNISSLFLLILDKSNFLKNTIELACINDNGNGIFGWRVIKNSTLTSNKKLIIRTRDISWIDVCPAHNDSIIDYYTLTDIDNIKLIKVDTIKNK